MLPGGGPQWELKCIDREKRTYVEPGLLSVPIEIEDGFGDLLRSATVVCDLLGRVSRSARGGVIGRQPTRGRTVITGSAVPTA